MTETSSPVSPTSPQRSGSMNSSHYLDLTSVNSGTTDLLDRRMESWYLLSKSLISYFQEVAICEEFINKRIGKVTEHLAVIEEPNESKKQFGLPEENGINKIIAVLIGADQQRALFHADTGSYITTTALADLKKLKADIKRVLKDLRSDHSSLNMRFAKARENSKNCYKKLSTSVSETMDVRKIEGEDPWIIHHEFQRQLQRDIHEDNVYRTKVRSSVSTILAFEVTIVERIKTVMKEYIIWRSSKLSLEKDELQDAKQIIEEIENDHEWRGFVARQDNSLLAAPADEEPFVEASLDSIEYPLKGHSYLSSLHEGAISRLSGMGPFKSWKDTYMIITATGFLYTFSDKNLLDQKSPDFCLHLTHCHLNPLKDDSEFSISGKQMSTMFGSEKGHQFRAKSAEDRAMWIKFIQQWTSDKTSPPAPQVLPIISPEIVVEPQAEAAPTVAPITEPVTKVSETSADPISGSKPQHSTEAASGPVPTSIGTQISPEPSAIPKVDL